jgi:hypothetical protein
MRYPFLAVAGLIILLAAVIVGPVTSALASDPAVREPAAVPCNRACLIRLIDTYLDALAARDPSRLPLAKNVKFTENGQRLVPGDGLWNTAGSRGSYSLVVADVRAGQADCFCTIRENGAPAILALRLKVADRKILEVETVVARDTAGALRLEKLGSPHPVFLEIVSASKRASRGELVCTADLYFTGLERNDGRGVYPFTDDCERIENGKQTTHNPSKIPRPFDVDALGCKEQFESGFFGFVTRIRDRRFVAVDEERGLALAFVFFDHAGNVPSVRLTNGLTVPIGVARPWTWEIAELFKVEDGLIRRVEAVVQEAPYGMNSGWSGWEEGLSGRVRESSPYVSAGRR